MAILSQRVVPTAVGDPAWSVIDSLKEPMQIQVYLRDLVLNRIPDRLGLDPVNDVQIITPTHLGKTRYQSHQRDDAVSATWRG